MSQDNLPHPQDPKLPPSQEAGLEIGETADFSPPRKQEQLRTTIGRVVQNDPLAAKRFHDLVGRALSKRENNDELI
jgi:hypothetical protein